MSHSAIRRVPASVQSLRSRAVWLLLALVLAVAADAPSAASQAQAPATADDLKQVQQMIDKGHTDEALKRLDELAVTQPVVPGVHRLQGQAYYAANRFSDADSAFAAALVQDPHDLESTQMRGLTLFRMGKPAEAIPLLTAAHNWGPQTRVDPSYVLALCYLDTRRYDDARHSFALQYGFPPDSASSYLLAARMLFRRDFVPVAKDFAEKALALDPQLPLVHQLLGEIALAGNHLDEAIAEFEKERARNPLDGAVYDRLGDAYSRAGNYQPALESLQRAVLLEPYNSAPYILLGKVLLRQQVPANAAMYLEHAVGMDPGNYMAHSLLGQAYRSLGRTSDASRETQTAEKLQADTEPKLQNVK
ncbi:tetratricopeptide repeat protein [Granulicella arctica]|uniref:Putative Zn-dependent protease n=1 Tax=Granulicella arctica TaxID=940613 RepID=A0A7Y9TJI7_9BACT|nr:tetratricopeptide repeat protein [Granulicella arctica]NYF78312.1 putative Zn-dependent protease [Granulicella arctica]